MKTDALIAWQPLSHQYTHEEIAKITEAVREADHAFEKEGGSSRHFVRDCLLDALASAGLQIVPIAKPTCTCTLPLDRCSVCTPFPPHPMRRAGACSWPGCEFEAGHDKEHPHGKRL